MQSCSSDSSHIFEEKLESVAIWKHGTIPLLVLSGQNLFQWKGASDDAFFGRSKKAIFCEMKTAHHRRFFFRIIFVHIVSDPPLRRLNMRTLCLVFNLDWKAAQNVLCSQHKGIANDVFTFCYALVLAFFLECRTINPAKLLPSAKDFILLVDSCLASQGLFWQWHFWAFISFCCGRRSWRFCWNEGREAAEIHLWRNAQHIEPKDVSVPWKRNMKHHNVEFSEGKVPQSWFPFGCCFRSGSDEQQLNYNIAHVLRSQVVEFLCFCMQALCRFFTARECKEKRSSQTTDSLSVVFPFICNHSCRMFPCSKGFQSFLWSPSEAGLNCFFFRRRMPRERNEAKDICFQIWSLVQPSVWEHRLWAMQKCSFSTTPPLKKGLVLLCVWLVRHCFVTVSTSTVHPAKFEFNFADHFLHGFESGKDFCLVKTEKVFWVFLNPSAICIHGHSAPHRLEKFWQEHVLSNLKTKPAASSKNQMNSEISCNSECWNMRQTELFLFLVDLWHCLFPALTNQWREEAVSLKLLL